MNYGYSNIRRLFFHGATAFVFFCIAAIGFIALADEVHEKSTTHFDDTILLFINGYSSSFGDSFYIWITNLGGVLFAPALSVALCAVLWRKGYKAKATVLGLSVVGASLLNLLVKQLFERARPDLWTTLVTESSFSFPSGHAMATSALALALLLICWDTRFRRHAIVLGALYTCVIGLSRLYLGVHYPTDVIGGWLLSTAWVGVVWFVWKTSDKDIVTHVRGKRVLHNGTK